MTRLSHSDWDRLSGFLRQLYAQTDLEQLPRTMLEGLHRLIPCEHAGYNEVNGKDGPVRFSLVPWVQSIVDMTPVVAQHLEEHPQLTYFMTHADRFPRQTLDFMSAREFRRLPIYREFFCHADTLNQLGMPLSEWGDGTSIGFTLNRKRGLFSPRDCQLLFMARPHLVQARKNAIAFAQAAHQAGRLELSASSASAKAILLDNAGRPTQLAPEAVRLIERYFPKSLKPASQLPAPVTRWLRATLSALRSDLVVTPPPQPLVVRSENSRLTIRFQPQSTQAARLILSEEHALTPLVLTQSLNLTPRQGEVLHWLTEGKSNPEIALILGTSPRTIHKHVEHLFDKLGVSTRQAAARQALRCQGVA